MKWFLFSIILLFISKVSADSGWSTPVPVTDSNSDNINCTTDFFDFDGDYQPDSLFMFWEKSSDGNTTSIYYRDLYSMSEPKVVLSQENVHFTNPQIMKSAKNDTLFYLFYETDQNGTKDIYFLKYLKNGMFSEPAPFRATAYEDKNIFTTSFAIVWIEEDDVYYSEYDYTDYFSAPLLIDENNCANPVLHERGYIAWEKIIGEKADIYYSNYAEGEWQSPALLYGIGDNRHLVFDQPDGMAYLVWQNKTASKWNIFFKGMEENLPVDSLDFAPASNKTEPSILFINYVTKAGVINNAPPSSVLTFVLDSTYAQDEIFAGEFDFENISNNEQKDRHPQLFEKRGLGQPYKVLNIWESHVNDRWQLFIAEKEYDINTVVSKKIIPHTIQLYQNYPNPFNPETRIQYALNSRIYVTLMIYNALGQKVRTLVKGEKSPGKYEINWNGFDDKGQRLASGTYFYQLVSDGIVQTKRMIYLK